MGANADIRESMASQLYSYLESASTWPCLRDGCNKRVDPDGTSQWCSNSCKNYCLAGKQNRNGYQKTMNKVVGNYRPLPIDHGLWQRPEPQVPWTTGRVISPKLPQPKFKRMKFTNPNWKAPN